jgi:multidrug resistance protein, MATE family
MKPNITIKKPHEIILIFTLSLPLMAAFLAQKGMQFIDTLMMGWIGPEALAAGALGTSIYINILLFCMGTLSSVGVFIVRAKGANNHSDIKSCMENGVYLTLLLAFPCMLVIWFMPDLLLLIGEDPVIIEKVRLLLHGLVWGFPGYLLFLLCREFIAAFSLTRIVMIVATSSIPLTFAANYLMIYGKFGFPQLGIAGIGYAGSLIMWYMFLCLFLYSKTHTLLKHHLPDYVPTFDRIKFLDMLHIGIPSGILLLLEASMFLAAAIIMGYFGTNMLAAHQIAMQCASIAYTIPLALSMSTSYQVGHAAGAKDITMAQRLIIFAYVIGIAISGALALFFIFSPDRLVKIFLSANDAHFNTIKQLTISFLLFSGLFQCFDAVQSIANGALRGFKDTWVPMLLSIGCYWLLGIGGGIYLSLYTSAGAKGVWIGLTIGIISIAIVLTLRLVKRLKIEHAKNAYAV